MALITKETNLSTEHNWLNNPNWQEADQFAIYKHDRRLTRVYRETTPAKWSEWDHPAPYPFGHAAVQNKVS